MFPIQRSNPNLQKKEGNSNYPYVKQHAPAESSQGTLDPNPYHQPG
jgi:hypothetical protein